MGKGLGHESGLTEDGVGSQVNQLFCQPSDFIGITSAPAKFDPKIDTLRPPQFREGVSQHRHLGLSSEIALCIGHQHANQSCALCLLCARN